MMLYLDAIWLSNGGNAFEYSDDRCRNVHEGQACQMRLPLFMPLFRPIARPDHAAQER